MVFLDRISDSCLQPLVPPLTALAKYLRTCIQLFPRETPPPTSRLKYGTGSLLKGRGDVEYTAACSTAYSTRGATSPLPFRGEPVPYFSREVGGGVSRTGNSTSFLKQTAPAFICFSLLLSACQSKYYFEDKKDIPQGQWAYSDTLDFRFSIADTSKTYNLYLDFTYADTFPTQNIYLKLHTRFPDGKRLSKQISFDLFDAQGVPNGECSGHKCRYLAVLQENAYFNQTGEYVITAEQYTRQDALPGIVSLGLAVELTGARDQ